MNSKLFDEYEHLVFLDTETTGFDPKKNQIIEYAALPFTKEGPGEPVDTYVQLEIEPDIPEKITDITGITALQCATGISERKLIDLMTEMFTPNEKEGKILLVAHNAQFDLNFIAETYIRHIKETGYSLIRSLTKADYLDTLTVYKDRAGYPHKLKDAITHYGLDGQVQNTHRAIDDAKALWAVFDAMAAERDDLADYINLFGYNEKYGISGPKFKKVTYAAQGYQFSTAGANETFPVRIGKVKHKDRKPEGGDADAANSK